ncbi:MAG: hypothetical protein ABIO24_14035, partial [Saprospiraceae bacterium]
MKICYRIALFALLLLSQYLPAQDTLLQLREVPNTRRQPIDLPNMGLPIVDINSQIEIRPNIQAIEAAGQAQFPQFFKDKLLSDKVARIEKALRNQQQIIALTQQLVDGLDVGRDLRRQLREYVKGIQADPELRGDFNRYLKDFDEQFTDPETAPDPFVYSLQRFNEQMQHISEEIKKVRQDAQIQFSIAAFRRDGGGGGRIHVENFDRFENGEFFSVPRWVTTLSGNDRARLDNLG